MIVGLLSWHDVLHLDTKQFSTESMVQKSFHWMNKPLYSAHFFSNFDDLSLDPAKSWYATIQFNHTCFHRPSMVSDHQPAPSVADWCFDSWRGDGFAALLKHWNMGSALHPLTGELLASSENEVLFTMKLGVHWRWAQIQNSDIADSRSLWTFSLELGDSISPRSL